MSTDPVKDYLDKEAEALFRKKPAKETFNCNTIADAIMAEKRFMFSSDMVYEYEESHYK